MHTLPFEALQLIAAHGAAVNGVQRALRWAPPAGGLVLRIGPSTTEADVAQWMAATHSRADAPAVMIDVAGSCQAPAWEATVASLAGRGALRRLHIRSAGVCGRAAARVPAWQPLTQLGGLVGLRISGVAAGDALLPALPPSLRELRVAGAAGGVPLLLADEACEGGSCGDGLSPGLPGLAQLTALCTLELQLAPLPTALATTTTPTTTTNNNNNSRALDGGAARRRVAAVADALHRLWADLRRLRALRALCITGLPDVWRAAAAAGAVLPARLATLRATAEQLIAGQGQLQRVQLALDRGAATVAWAADGDACMGSAGGGAAAAAAAAAAYGHDRGTWSHSHTVSIRPARPATPPPAMADGVRRGPAAAGGDLLELAADQLAPYLGSGRCSTRVGAVTALTLSLPPSLLPQLPRLLASVPRLRSLKVTLLQTSAHAEAPLAALVAAVAAPGHPSGLTYLALTPGLAPATITASTLLPLARGALAEGLVALTLTGSFVAAADGAFAPLAALKRLQHLRVHHLPSSDGALLRVASDALPPSLRALDLHGVHLAGVAPGGGGVAALARCSLVGCALDTPTALEAPLLRHLLCVRTRVGGACGGWLGAAAPVAWPALECLTLEEGVVDEAAAGPDVPLFPALRHLELRRWSGLAAASPWDAVSRLPKLQTLSVDCGTPEVGVAAASRLAASTTLKGVHLRLPVCAAGPAVQQALHAALPWAGVCVTANQLSAAKQTLAALLGHTVKPCLS